MAGTTYRWHGSMCQMTPIYPVFAVWLTGEGADQMEQLSDDAVIDGCMTVLSGILKNHNLPRPTHIIR